MSTPPTSMPNHLDALSLMLEINRRLLDQRRHRLAFRSWTRHAPKVTILDQVALSRLTPSE